jgi:hypothetical protein
MGVSDCCRIPHLLRVILAPDLSNFGASEGLNELQIDDASERFNTRR